MLTLDIVEYFPGSLEKIQVCKFVLVFFLILQWVAYPWIRNIDEVSKYFVQKSKGKPGSKSAEKQK